MPRVFFKCEALLHGAFSARTRARAHARTRARYPCGHLGLNVNNSRIYGPIFFKIYTLILIAILRYHIKNHYICFSRFVFIRFLIRSLFEKKESRISDFGLPLIVNNSRINHPILFKICTLIFKAIRSYHAKNQCIILSRYDFTYFLSGHFLKKKTHFFRTLSTLHCIISIYTYSVPETFE